MHSTDVETFKQDEAWNRFERAVDAAVKSGPKPRVGEKSKPEASPEMGKAAKDTHDEPQG